VSFFDNTSIQAINSQPDGVSLNVRIQDSEMSVFVAYRRKKGDAVIWEGMRVLDPQTYQESGTCTVIVPDWIFEAVVLHFQSFTPGAWYRVELYRPHNPETPSRSDHFAGA
jgi:hypothetical protein